MLKPTRCQVRAVQQDEVYAEYVLPASRVRTGLGLPGAKRIGHRTHIARVAVARRTAAHLFDRTQHGGHVWKEVEVEEVEVEVERGGCARCMGPVAE